MPHDPASGDPATGNPVARGPAADDRAARDPAAGDPARRTPVSHLLAARRRAAVTIGRAGAAVAAVALLTAPAGLAQPGAVPPPIDQPGGLNPGACLPVSGTTQVDVPWAQQRLLPERVWPVTRGAGVTVAVIDTGVDPTSPQLAGRVLPGTDVLGIGPGDVDCTGHGTFVAGIIAAGSVEGVGFAGVAPEVTVLPIRQTTDGNDGTAAGLATAIRMAADSGATVANVSLAAFYPSPDLEAAVAYAAERDLLVVASASNEANNGDPTSYPAAYPGVLAVAAVDSAGEHSGFSATGDYVSVAAPGENVVSVGPRGPNHYVGSGTSYAAPFVSGVAALVRAVHPELSAAQVKRRIELTADRPSRAVPDLELGWGVVNPYGAVTAILPDETADAVVPQTVTPRAHLVPATLAVSDPGRTAATVVAGLAAAVVVLLLIGRAVLPSGRGRHWRPAGRPATATATHTLPTPSAGRSTGPAREVAP